MTRNSALNVRDEERPNAVSRPDAADANKVEEILDTEDAADAGELFDDRLDALLPLAQVHHPRDQVRRACNPETVPRRGDDTLLVGGGNRVGRKLQLFDLSSHFRENRGLPRARLPDQQDTGRFTSKRGDQPVDLRVRCHGRGELPTPTSADRLGHGAEVLQVRLVLVYGPLAWDVQNDFVEQYRARRQLPGELLWRNRRSWRWT